MQDYIHVALNGDLPGRRGRRIRYVYISRRSSVVHVSLLSKSSVCSDLVSESVLSNEGLSF